MLLQYLWLAIVLNLFVESKLSKVKKEDGSVARVRSMSLYQNIKDPIWDPTTGTKRQLELLEGHNNKNRIVYTQEMYANVSSFYHQIIPVNRVKFRVDFDNRASPRDQDGRRRGHDPALRIRNEYPVQLQVKDNLRIRGGNITDTLNYPYMAAIIINGRLWCAGAIVDENWVVTAAHCLNYVLHVSPLKSLSKYVKVRVGSSKPHEGGALVDVIGAVRHPKFEEEPVPHADVALLKLAENLEFHKHVNLIKIYDATREPYAQSFIVVTGWGATRGSDTAFRDHTSDLLTARLKVRSQQYCIDAYQLVNGFQFTQDFFCASLRNGTRDACLFDAGAPAVQQNRLMGIMSFGPERCGHEFQPAVFVKAFYFRDFVKSTISAYKTTADLIEAMQDVDPNIKPPVHTIDEVDDMFEVELHPEVSPDLKHD